MSKVQKTLLVILLTTITVAVSGCATHLPADFPKPPAINLCVPVLTGQSGDTDRMVAYWKCQKTDAKKARKEAANYVQIGIPVEDWNAGQNYRRSVEEYFKSHSCTKR